MELWIRSQYGSLLEKAEAIKISNYDGTIGIVINNGSVFGEYKTKERAIEVLDEIQKLIKPITIFQNCQVDKSTIEKIKEMGYCMVNNDVRVEQISQAFYQMPKD